MIWGFPVSFSEVLSERPYRNSSIHLQTIKNPPSEPLLRETHKTGSTEYPLP